MALADCWAPKFFLKTYQKFYCLQRLEEPSAYEAAQLEKDTLPFLGEENGEGDAHQRCVPPVGHGKQNTFKKNVTARCPGYGLVTIPEFDVRSSHCVDYN
jgi:hypothetical protein